MKILAFINDDTNKILGEVEVPDSFTDEMAIRLDEMLRGFGVLSEHQSLDLVDIF